MLVIEPRALSSEATVSPNSCPPAQILETELLIKELSRLSSTPASMTQPLLLIMTGLPREIFKNELAWKHLG